ncbi:Lipid A biosynthesis palmitoleoyltransferase [BD1-7 clade bacterium]|uniref:Lipid A biosynthesis acyltransferase n=1 Tax=BD1-7 clade bacterium TaxID=2029982 RepID=A0A5S9R244_9GAMM|nr:Lipid A biosynthesis palmitoleoyltransferase [BD1-7 clade bacterium]
MPKSCIHPRYWPTWMGLGLLWLVTRLPHKWIISLGTHIGHLLYYILKRRRNITEVNVQLCFPEKNADEQEKIVKAIFANNACGILEAAIGWWWPEQKLRGITEIRGLDVLEETKAEGKGVLCLGAHFTTLELCGTLMPMYTQTDATYRPQNNEVMDWMILKNRQRNCGAVIDRNNTRLFIRRLKQGNTVWYAPDQDYGAKHSVFAPFFGVEAATIVAANRLVNITKSPIVVCFHYRKPDNSGYVIEYFRPPALNNFPSGDDQQDALSINQVMEEIIRKKPEQYMWVHRRFKTRPVRDKHFYTTGYQSILKQRLADAQA